MSKKQKKLAKGQLLRYYYEDDRLFGLFLGTKDGKHFVYWPAGRHGENKRVTAYDSLDEVTVLWREAFPKNSGL